MAIEKVFNWVSMIYNDQSQRNQLDSKIEDL